MKVPRENLVQSVEEKGHKFLSIVLSIAGKLGGPIGQQLLKATRFNRLFFPAPKLTDDDGKRQRQ